VAVAAYSRRFFVITKAGRVINGEFTTLQTAPHEGFCHDRVKYKAKVKLSAGVAYHRNPDSALS
jgi:hypothetical protein